jgi:hypothetical protein
MKITTQDFTADKLLKWLKTQPPEREFEVSKCDKCLFASFAEEVLKAKDVSCGRDDIWLDNNSVELPKGVAKMMVEIIDKQPYCTASQAIAALEKVVEGKEGE